MAATKIKTSGKVMIILLIVASIFVGKIFWWDKRPKAAKSAMTIGHLALPDAPEASLKGSSTMLALPTKQESVNSGTKIVWEIMEWNSQFGLMYANGGALTTKGSLFDKSNLQVKLTVQNDCNKSIADMVKFASEYKKDPTIPGVFCSYMGDGMPAFFTALVKELEPLGPEYQPIAFCAMGRSAGEDKFMGPKEWVTNPKSALGKCVCMVPRDGDMNILLKWAGDNSNADSPIKINPDETTYDPNAINIIATNDYLDAANKYITNYTEGKFIMKDGKKTSEKITVKVDGVCTWTPGDVNIATKKGGLVTIASTKEYSTQMPNITITIKKFAYDHRTDIEGVIMSLAQAGDQVRSFNEAKKFASEVTAKVYNENDKDASYWLKYYNGETQKDITGLEISLGGSMVFNLQDAANNFGLGKDGIDRYKIVYNTFGDILSKMYPELMPKFPEYSKVVDKSFIMSVISNHPELMTGEAMKTTYNKEMTTNVSSKSYQIQFDNGKSTIKSESYPVLDQILNSSVVAEGLKLGIFGHTDNTGTPDGNITLSEARANSVRSYLMSKGLSSNRIEVKGCGQTQPIADNSTKNGKAKNRRVQIVLGK